MILLAFVHSWPCIVPGDDKDLEFFLDLVSEIEWGRTKLNFDGNATFAVREGISGRLHVKNEAEFEVLAQYFGDTEWISTKSIPASRRIFHLF